MNLFWKCFADVSIKNDQEYFVFLFFLYLYDQTLLFLCVEVFAIQMTRSLLST